MLGQSVQAELEARDFEFLAAGRDQVNLADPTSVAKIANGELGSFDWCINCAAYTAVDLTESNESAAYEANATGAGNLAQACAEAKLGLIHVSTDFVFNGEAETPYTEGSPTHPLGVYGASKLKGEELVRAQHPNALICRTSWLYGAGGPSFPRTIIRAWEAGRDLKVVADQIGCPTFTDELARILVSLTLANAEPGIYHTTGNDSMSWADFALMALIAWQPYAKREDTPQVAKISTADWPTPAKRPGYSVLSNEKLHGLGIRAHESTSASLDRFTEQLAFLVRNGVAL